AVAPSTLETVSSQPSSVGRLPLDATTFFTGPNSLKIAWKSKAGGAWAAEVAVLIFRNRDYHFDGDTLSFWVYAPEAIVAKAMPQLRLLDQAKQFSNLIAVGEFSGDIPAKKWTRVFIPLSRIETGSIHPF